MQALSQQIASNPLVRSASAPPSAIRAVAAEMTGLDRAKRRFVPTARTRASRMRYPSANGFLRQHQQGLGVHEAGARDGQGRSQLLKPSVYQVMISIVYWVIWIAIFIGGDIDPESGTAKVFGVVSLFGSFLIFYFFCGVTVNMIDVYLSGGKPSVKEGIADARQNFVAIAFLALISTLVELVAKAVRGRGEGDAAIVTSIIAGIIESIWTIVSFLLLPAIIIEDCSLGDALKRVRKIHKGNFLLVGIGEVGIRLITNVLGLLVMLLLFALGYLSFGILGGTPGLVLGILTIGTVLSLFIAFATYLRMADYTCLYLWASNVERDGQNALAPLPLARALQR